MDRGRRRDREKVKGDLVAVSTGLGKKVWTTFEMPEDDPGMNKPKEEKSVNWWRGKVKKEKTKMA